MSESPRRPERSEGHALSVRRLRVASDERASYLARLAERRASASACGVHFWAFERENGAGEFLEFVETRDRASLATALAQDARLAESLDFRLAPARDEAAVPNEIWLEIAPTQPT